MDDPGMSLFQGDNLNIGNNENQEEAEDLEEQIKRREELQNLLINALDDFKYDDSTINSSTNISVASTDAIDQAYKDAQSPYEQFKVLYDLRMKEIQALKEEFDGYKLKTKKEVDDLKRKLTLQEAETSQSEISLRNTKSLLVEKADIIAKQEKKLAEKDEEIEKLKKLVEQLQYDVQAYNSTIEEIQLKLQMDTGPLNMAARVFNVEELQKNHREQVEKLEILLEEKKRKCETLEKEVVKLNEDLKNTIENFSENEMLQNNTIQLLNTNVESAQNQCKDLLSVVEMLSKENDHYRGRIEKLESGDPILLSGSFRRKSLDYETLASLNERLKKMLLDKDVEVSSLKIKSRFYENDIRELLEYKSVKHKSLLNKNCNQIEHVEKFAILQNEIKKLQRDLKEKSNEVIEQNSINKELEEKIEQMILQTRNDLENLSMKYKLPELETMNAELRNAELKIEELESKLAKYENDERKTKFDKNSMNEMKTQLEEEEIRVVELEEIIKVTQSESETKLLEENALLKERLEKLENFQMEYNLLQKEYNRITTQLQDLNQDENSNKTLTALRADIENFWSVFKSSEIHKESLEIKIASWINQINLNCLLMRNLTESKHKLKETIKTLNNNLKATEEEKNKLSKRIEEIENSNKKLQRENIDILNELEKTKNYLTDKTKEVESLKSGDATVQTLENASQHLEEAKVQLLEYQEQLMQKCNVLKQNEEELETVKMNWKSAKAEIEMMTQKISELEKNVDRRENDSDEKFHKAKLLNAEVVIRDELRKEYEKKTKKIEDTYRSIFEVNQEKLNKYKEQENHYRVQLTDILNKYARVIAPIQKENDELRDYLKKIEERHNEMKFNVENTQKECNRSIENTRKDAQRVIDEWKIWAKTFVQGCLSIEKLNAQSRNRILSSLQEFDSQVDSIDKIFEEKMKQFKKKSNLSKVK